MNLFSITIGWSQLKHGILVGMTTSLLFACKKDEVATRYYPVIDTRDVTEISVNGATFNAELLNLGTSGIRDHGFVYSDTPMPALDNSDNISLGETAKKGTFSAVASRNLAKNKRYYVKAYVVLKNNDLIVYGQQREFIGQGGAQPEIFTFFPQAGTMGDTLVIVGKGFSGIPTNNKISLGGMPANVIKGTLDSLWFTVPENTLVGENTVSLAYGELAISASSKFTLKGLVILSISPQWVSFGDVLTMNVENVPKQISKVAVTILGKQATLLSRTGNELKAQVSEDVVMLEQPVVIKAGSQTVKSDLVVKLKPPIISSFAPTEAKGGAVITIHGENFNLVKDYQYVKFGDFVTEIVDVQRNQLTVKLPTGFADQMVNIFMTVSGQTVASSDQFHMLSPWRKIADCPNGPIVYATAWSACGYGYVTAGYYDSNRVWRYDPASDTWNQVTPMPYNTASGELFAQTSFSIGCDGFVGMGGFGPGNSLTTMYKYAPATNDWQEVSYFSPNQQSRYNALSWGLNGAGYFTFGSNGYLNAANADTWKYTSSSDNWTRVADFPVSPPNRSAPSGFEVGNKGYLVAGTNQDFWEYDATLDHWNQLPNFPGKSRAGANSVGINSFGYVFCGNTNFLGDTYQEVVLNEVWRYDVNTTSWSRLEDFPGPARQWAVTFVIGNKAYYGTGFGADFYGDFWEFDPSKL